MFLKPFFLWKLQLLEGNDGHLDVKRFLTALIIIFKKIVDIPSDFQKTKFSCR